MYESTLGAICFALGITWFVYCGLKTAESIKSVGLKHSNNEIIMFLRGTGYLVLWQLTKTHPNRQAVVIAIYVYLIFGGIPMIILCNMFRQLLQKSEPWRTSGRRQ